MEQHSPAVLAYARRRCPSVDDAEDVLQRTFEVAWRRLDDVPGGDEAAPWLIAVARYNLKNERRGLERREQLALRLALASPRFAELEPEDRDEVRAVLAAMSKLTPAQREILLLAAWDGLSHAQIGVILGCTASASAVRLHRARARLEEILGKEGGGFRT
jgi:RNA polymerase sigma factor (sigma-70 family)